MKSWVCIIGLWLVGIGHAWAFDMSTAETLQYRVYWGPVSVGDARLDYTPNGSAYMLRAEVKDDSSLIDLHDVWESRGRHSKTRAFMPDTYTVTQAENDYRAHKTMRFDRKAKQVLYTNHIDVNDKVEPLELGLARDVLATVYAWRVAGETDVTKAARVPLVSLKREITLDRKAGVRDSIQLNGKKVSAWRVDMHVIKGTKPSKDTWSVYVSEDAARTPLKIVAKTKFGTFQAILKK